MSQGKFWVWTLNNPLEDGSDVLRIKDWPNVGYTVFGLEHFGEGEGTPHYQGYTEFTNNRRLSALKKLDSRIHWERRKGTNVQARDYCLKEGGESHEVGKFKPIAKRRARTDLEEVKEMLDAGATEKEIADAHFGTWCRSYKAFERYKNLTTKPKEKPHVTVLYGPTGTGKSMKAMTDMPKAFWLDSKWWDGYDNHEDVIIDEFNGWLPFGQLLRILDRYPLRVQNKGGSVPLVAKRIIITSHFHPKTWYKNDRYPELRRRIDQVVSMGDADVASHWDGM